MTTSFSPKNAKKFYCEVCDTSCAKLTEWNRHINTNKHKSNINGENINPLIICKCGKTYKDRSGLWRHSKICTFVPEDTLEKDEIKTNSVHTIIHDNEYLKNLVIEVVKTNSELQRQNQEFQIKMMEMYTKSGGGNSSNVNSLNNNNNKTFNMQFFLNEQCKDAMNIMDFVDTFKLEFSDLERVGEVGYVEGISGIIIKKLNELDIYKRPIHCSDVKRETMYVKDKDVWAKENGNHDKLRLAIRYITKKNTDMLLSWCHAHPGSCDSDNYLNDLYLQMVQQAMGAGNIEENENKIMRKIAKTVLIDKGLPPL